MREILFRGKRTDSDEWCFGNYVSYESGEAGIFSRKFSRYGYEATEICFRNKVIPETIGQFTGLTDKNGVKIFEGDILRYTSEDCNYITEVWAYGNTLCVDIVGEDYGYTAINFANDIWNDNDYKIEVIGNIHDNPELLKE